MLILTFAVSTDLKSLLEITLYLKNIKTKLPKLDNFPGKVIPAVALYNDNPYGYPFWAEFHPVPVIHGIRDKNRINLIMSGLSKNKLNTLEEYIKKWILK